MPVDAATLGAFTVAVVAIVVSPGPDTMLILRHTLIGGRASGLAAVFGVQVGIAVHTLLAVAGVSLLIRSSPLAFKTLAFVGALYLGWLGLKNLFGRGDLAAPAGNEPTPGEGLWRPFREAVLTNLLNPKVILLFLALFPNFVDAARGGVTGQLLFLALVLVVINVAWQAPMAFAATWIRRRMADPGFARAVARITGIVFLAFAAMMLWEHLLRPNG